MINTPASTSVQLARAQVIGKSLIRSGWSRRREPDGAHPGATDVAVYRHGGVGILVLTLGGRHGQIVEIVADAVDRATADHGRITTPGRPSWRVTCYDAPAEATLAAARAAADSPHGTGPSQVIEWAIEYAPARGRNAPNTVRATRFTRPDGAVVATFHNPTYVPPCETCPHGGDLGDAGGWIIAGPGFTAEATAHTPSAVINAFLLALPGNARPAAPVDGATEVGQRRPRRRAMPTIVSAVAKAGC